MTFDDRVPPGPPHEAGPSAVIDSQLVRDGRAAHPHAHLERFAAALETAFGVRSPGRAAVEAFWREGIASIPATGSWFPLAQAYLVGDEVRLEFTVRPAPPVRATTRLAIAADQRRFPLLKGADGERTAGDRGAARDLGDDDALYLDARGRVIEAANGAVVGWRRERTDDGVADVLVLPDTDRALPSTTVAAMRGSLADAAVPARASVEPFAPADVDELWYVNALHGLTPVVGIDGAERDYDAARLADWRGLAERWWTAL